MLRGAAAAVFVVLLGAWATGVGPGDAKAPIANLISPDSDESPTPPVYQRGSVLEKAAPRRTHRQSPSPSQVALTEPSQDTSDDPTSEAPSTSTPPSTPDSSTPPPPPSSHTSSPSPSPSPSDEPSEPSDDCSGLVNCVLDPITGHPRSHG